MEILKKAKVRTEQDEQKLKETVAGIIDDVRKYGDEKLKEYSVRFDGSKRESFRVSKEEIEEAYSRMTDEEISDLKAALHNLEGFAKAQRDTILPLDDYSPVEGVHLGHRVIPVDSCLCYVPGGSYPLFSSALMLITPAKVAGVRRVAAASPVEKGTGSVNYKTLVAMDMAGADEIYAVGGAQAIAAFSYGTEEIEKVDMIVGPGNQYVAEAKRQCYGKVGIDFFAGPSEVLIIADGAADPVVLAADMLAQSEHDVNAKAILVTDSRELADSAVKAVEAELEWLDTAEIASKSWEVYGEVILVDDMDEAVKISNEIAPEHLEVNIEDPMSILEGLKNYGSLFLGGNTAEVFGDYASGTNHTLPTVGAARYTGGVYVGTFLKTCTHQWMTDEGTEKLAPLVERMANGERLTAHANAAKVRIKDRD